MVVSLLEYFQSTSTATIFVRDCHCKISLMKKSDGTASKIQDSRPFYGPVNPGILGIGSLDL